MEKRKFGPLAPLLVIKHFWYTLFWWAIIFITLIGPVIDAIMQEKDKFKYFILSGTLYYSVITLLFSFVITIIIDILFETIHDKRKPDFIHYQLTSVIIATIGMMFLVFLYVMNRKNICMQITISIIGYLFSFYMYCISCMPRVREELMEYSLSYDAQRKKHSSEITDVNEKTSDGINL